MAGVGGFVQGIAQGIHAGSSIDLQRRSLDQAEAREKRIAEIMGEQSNLQKQHLALQQQAQTIGAASQMINVVNAIQAMPDSLKGTLAPQLLKPFVDVTTDEGKAFVKAATAMDEEGSAYFKSIVGGMFKSPEVREALSTPKMQQQFRLNPIATLTQLTALSHGNDPKSEAGRQQMDRENLIGRYGASSVEVANFDRATGQGGPFRGTGLDAQAINILLDPKMDPASPTYRAAYAEIAKPRFDLGSGQMIKPDMSAYRSPGQMTAAGGSTNLPPPGATPTGGRGGPTVEQLPGFDPKMTGEQANAALFADRMARSSEVLVRLERVNQQPGTGTRVVRSLPLIGESAAADFVVPESSRLYEQAQRDFINAVLRRESGAVISSEEFDNAAKQYFPRPGDTPALIKQKRENRETALNGIARAAGPGYKLPDLRPAGRQREEGDDIPSPPKGFKVIP